jgi:hypothetical protein
VDGDSAHTDPIGIGLSNGSPLDVNIRESFPAAELQSLIRDFAGGKLGSNMMSITLRGSGHTHEGAAIPGALRLVRMRIGGWSSFFVAVFSEHQEQQERRPISNPGLPSKMACRPAHRRKPRGVLRDGLIWAG